MWASIAAFLGPLVQWAIKQFGPPSAEELAALQAACKPLESPDLIDKLLEDDARDRSKATTVPTGFRVVKPGGEP